MDALLVSYTLKKANINQKTNLHRILYGYIDHSNKGSHKYERKGLLNKYPSVKLNRGVFIITIKDQKEILAVLKKNRASIQLLKIDVNESILN
jgi:hypothetical protein